MTRYTNTYRARRNPAPPPAPPKPDNQVLYGEASIDQMIPLAMEARKKDRQGAKALAHSIGGGPPNIVLAHRKMAFNYRRNEHRALKGRYNWNKGPTLAAVSPQSDHSTAQLQSS